MKETREYPDLHLRSGLALLTIMMMMHVKREFDPGRISWP